jgi:hypothetical protein
MLRTRKSRIIVTLALGFIGYHTLIFLFVATQGVLSLNSVLLFGWGAVGFMASVLLVTYAGLAVLAFLIMSMIRWIGRGEEA